MVTKTKPAIVVIVVAAAALMATATLLPLTMAVTPAFAEGQEKVTVCHRPSGDPDKEKELTLGEPGANNHDKKHFKESIGGC